MRSVHCRPAFTLLEVIVALMVSSVVVMGGRLLFASVADQGVHIAAAEEQMNRVANRDRVLRTLVGRLEIATDSVGPFEGTPTAARFTTWCDTPSGWLERCDVTISLETHGDTNVFVAHMLPRTRGGDLGVSTIEFARGFQDGALRYLNDASAGGTWFVRWGTGIVAPLAIGIILDHDTTIVRIGDRG